MPYIANIVYYWKTRITGIKAKFCLLSYLFAKYIFLCHPKNINWLKTLSKYFAWKKEK